MATFLSTSPKSSSSQTRMIVGLLLGAFLFFTYRIISIEVTAHHGEKLVPTKALAPASTAPQTHPTTIQTLSQPLKNKQEVKPRAKRARKGSRREWYERRKRRWFTPPAPKMDTGLPRRRSSFKMA